MQTLHMPSGWKSATVGELCGKPRYGYTESATHEAVGPRLLRITDIQNGRVDWSVVPYCRCDEPAQYRLDDGDILFARTGATTGKSLLVRQPPESVFASYLIRIRPGTRVLPEYVWWYFQSPYYWASVMGEIDIGNRPNMNGAKLAALRVPFPTSKTEQRRLVARIEALTSRLELARHARQNGSAEAEALKQAAWDRTFTSIPKDRWVSIGRHARVQGGYAFKSDWFVTEGIRLLRNQNVYHGALDWSETVHLRPERRAGFADFDLREGDVVISMDRPLIKSGLKAARVQKADLPCLLLQRVGRFLCDDDLDPDFLLHFLFSQHFIPYVSGDGRSCAVPHISAKQIEAVAMPLPNRREQERVVEHLNAVQAKLEEFRDLQAETDADLTAFTPALLAKAFRGEL